MNKLTLLTAVLLLGAPMTAAADGAGARLSGLFDSGSSLGLRIPSIEEIRRQSSEDPSLEIQEAGPAEIPSLRVGEDSIPMPFVRGPKTVPMSKVEAPKPGEHPEKPSSLQIAIQQCPMIMVVRDIRSGADFIRVYGQCIRGAKGLQVKLLRQDPEAELGVVAYSAAGKEAVRDMAGVVTLWAESGLIRVYVSAYPEVMAHAFARVPERMSPRD